MADDQWERARIAAPETTPETLMLRLLPLADGALLVVTSADLLRVDVAGVHPIALDVAARRELAAVAAKASSWPGTPRAVATGGGRAVLFTLGHGLAIDGLTACSVDLSGDDAGRVGEVIDVAREARDGVGGHVEWVAVTIAGTVLRGEGARWRRVGTLQGMSDVAVPHVVAAFTGGDGVARVVTRDMPLVCVERGGLRPCGPVVSLWPWRVAALADGLLVEDQGIRAHLLDARGDTALDEVVGGALDAAGPVAAPYALIERWDTPDRTPARELRRFCGGHWERVARIPTGFTPRRMAIWNAMLVVGCDGGALLERELAGSSCPRSGPREERSHAPTSEGRRTCRIDPTRTRTASPPRVSSRP